ncbi:MAG: SIS domain-containing protein [Tabrizicola sp.]|uniref:SIS domain-containing protein n=1 Tax=Tabrizicola sp. TaxID=2005166 RepID=UPI002AB86C12|nr:SIS domain-containing protein [Tabrizicola sp.]MDZ4086640.1 SIS domain-containing protein [Tabrizicola sp.]
MTDLSPTAGQHMQREIAEAPQVFAAAIAQPVTLPDLTHLRAIYTVARGSSDAAANILSYELMRETSLPVTSLPPSIFSLGHGVRLDDSAVLVVSQSGASDDLVRSARGARQAKATVLALTNAPNSPVEAEAHTTLTIAAGPELAVPATKSVVGAIAAGMALLSALAPAYAPRAKVDAHTIAALQGKALPQQKALLAALLRASHVYVIGRDTGFGAAQELALKLKECCALHAEAYSSSEVLHGPLQLVTNPLLILILDTEQPDVQPSLDTAEQRFRAAGGTTFRLRPSDAGATNLTPAAAAAALLILTYPLTLQTALALGHDPDRPATLSKVTQTR